VFLLFGHGTPGWHFRESKIIGGVGRALLRMVGGRVDFAVSTGLLVPIHFSTNQIASIFLNQS
jgi:hypothetical protein